MFNFSNCTGTRGRVNTMESTKKLEHVKVYNSTPHRHSYKSAHQKSCTFEVLQLYNTDIHLETQDNSDSVRLHD